MNIHAQALTKFGLDDRVAKLREEALELALACDRYLVRRATLEDVVAEACDVHVVSASIRQAELELWALRMDVSETKLEQALCNTK